MVGSDYEGTLEARPPAVVKPRLVYDSSDYDETESEKSDERESFQPETEWVLQRHVQYDNQELKQLVTEGLQYVARRKSESQRKHDKMIDRAKAKANMLKDVDRYLGKLKLRHKLLDLDYLRKRYSELSTLQKQ